MSGAVVMGKRILNNDWHAQLNGEFDKPYYLELRKLLWQEYQTQVIYPPMHDIFNALHYTPFANVKVVVLGQDPYHGPNQAHGLSFSVQKGIPQPPSLKNIFKELQDDVGCTIPAHGCLTSWAKQGVLLLNTTLTVRKGAAASHAKFGWGTFTDQVIRVLNEKETPVVYILWGRHAQSKKVLIDTNKHCVIESVHPSPLSAHGGFLGSKPFSRANEFLRENGITAIDWQIN